MKKVFDILTMSFLIICLTSLFAWANPRKEPHSAQCIFLIDGSQSYKYLDKAKDTLMNTIITDNSCVKIYVRWISDDSYLDKNSITSAMLNDVNKINNPFSITAKRQKAKLMRENEEIKRNIINTVKNSKSPNSPITDIYGALMASSARFSREPNLKSKLFIFSDLEDDAKKENKYTINLLNTNVYVMDFQSNEESEVLKRYWINFFKKAGAMSVDIRHMDEPLTRYTKR
ncbi:MAG TPA: hypothetical protein PK564_02600 [bacterium]|nr:hypothetical protein [bacterium]